MERGPIYGIGDKVRIVNYGHPIMQVIQKNKKDKLERLPYPLIFEDESVLWLDMSPGIVGLTGIVCEVSMTQGTPQYAIDGIPEKTAWYSESQMEMINRNPNR